MPNFVRSKHKLLFEVSPTAPCGDILNRRLEALGGDAIASNGMANPRIVVCASGDGSNFEAIAVASRSGELRADVVGLISNRAKIGAIGRANRLGIGHQTFKASQFTSPQLWDRAIAEQLTAWRADWVVLAGFLARIGPEVLAQFADRVVNSHPALLPKFGGPGMYGQHVFEAVIAAGELETGLTFHLVNSEYDKGQIIEQIRIPVRPGETPSQLAQRVKAEENKLYPKILNNLIHPPH